MAKRPSKPDSTMPLSESQVVAVTPKPPDHAIPKNDRSVWKGMVVGADEFAPPPKRSKKRWLAITALGIAAGGAGIAGYEMYSGGSGSGSGAGSVVSGSAAGAGSAGSGSMVVPAAAVTPDAPPPADAAPPVDAAPPPADAAPADAAPAPKPVKKKPVRKQRRH